MSRKGHNLVPHGDWCMCCPIFDCKRETCLQTILFDMIYNYIVIRKDDLSVRLAIILNMTV